MHEKRVGIFRQGGGGSLIEMMSALIIVIPAFLCLIDLYFVIMGYWWSTSACTLAARAAAQGPPNALIRKGPEMRAKQALEGSAPDPNSPIHLVDYTVSETVKRLPDSVVGGAVSGSVTVDINTVITPPFVLRFAVPQQKFAVHASHTCPYTYVRRPAPPADPIADSARGGK
jgi:hypothetical protein